MNVNGKAYRTIWRENDFVQIIDQRWLPYEFKIELITSLEEMCIAISEMHVRGAGLIGAAAAYGMALASNEAQKANSFDDYMVFAGRKLKETRPTAVNLAVAVERMSKIISKELSPKENTSLLWQEADDLANEDAEMCRQIGLQGVKLIEEFYIKNPKQAVNILTHCNAGWLAFVDYGSALAPVYEAHRNGIPIHVWVDETRPRNQGSKLTAWELEKEGVPHTIIADNTGGHLMQHGMVDLCIVGSDRTTRTGDVANKIGTYLKALAAFDNNIPFYAAMPSSTIDWNIVNGLKEIPIEQRATDEVKYAFGLDKEGEKSEVLLCPEKSSLLNYGFDVSPARLISGIITERGVCKANEKAILELFPEKQ